MHTRAVAERGGAVLLRRHGGTADGLLYRTLPRIKAAVASVLFLLLPLLLLLLLFTSSIVVYYALRRRHMASPLTHVHTTAYTCLGYVERKRLIDDNVLAPVINQRLVYQPE